MPRRKRPVIGIDYIMDGNGRAQFTREYLLRGGTCCEHECKYCPYKKSDRDGAEASQLEVSVNDSVCSPMISSS